MSFSFRAATLLFSLLVHGSIAAAAFFFTGSDLPREEKIYRVSLAEFSPAAPAAPVMPVQETAPVPEQPAPAVPEPEPEPEPAPPPPKPEPPQPQPRPRPRPRPKTERPRPRPVESKPRQAPSTFAQTDTQQATVPQSSASATPGGGPRMIGGLSAYAEDAVDQRPSISRRVMPEYPERARRLHIQGQVVVRLIVDVSGNPQQCVIHLSEPGGVFDQAALAAAGKTRFIPGKVNGKPVNTVILLPYRFALR